jgi:hypothetical protein
MTTLADDLLLVLLDPASGKPRATSGMDFALAGALLFDLTLAERVGVDGPAGAKARVVVLDATPPADDLLADALRLVGERQRTTAALVPVLAKHLRDRLLERGERRGDLRRDRRTLLPDLWPAANDGRRRQLASRLRDVLIAGVSPDQRTVALVALLAVIGAAGAAVDAPDRATRKAVTRRAAEIGDGAWAAQGVSGALKAAQAAITAATVAALTAATASTIATS